MVRLKLTRTNIKFTFRYIVSVFIIFILVFILMRFPEVAGQGISDGIDLCLGTLIPSLLPFMIVSSLTVNLNIFNAFEKLFSKATNKLFRLPGNFIGIIFMSFIGGYPVGGKIIKDLYEKGEISPEAGKRALLFCINPGPAFVISYVGFYMLGSKKAGVILYVSIILSTLIIGIITRFLSSENVFQNSTIEKPSAMPLSDCIARSVLSGSRSMLIICSWVIVFSCLSRLTELFNLSSGTNLFINSIIEVTNGCYLACGNLNLPAIACIIGFGGICTHFQVADAIRTVKLPYKYFFTSRIVHGALSAVICNLLLNAFPVSYDVFSSGTLPTREATASSVIVSTGMLVMCALVMLGDTFNIKIRCITQNKA